MSRIQAFFEYLTEREQIRLRKEADLPFPWTEDPILRAYKFTNVRRHHDKTSDVLRKTFYGKHFHDDRESILMNCALFRYFGTWEFAQAVGWQRYDDFDFEGIKEIARTRLLQRERVFTGAYVITNQGISAPKQEVVVDYFLKDLHAATPAILDVLKLTQKWEYVAKRMKQIGGFGGTGFMTKEVLLDTTYTGFWNDIFEDENDGTFSFPVDWWKWTPIGPGALRGAARVCIEDKVNELVARNVIQNLYEAQFKHRSFPFRLSPTDIQFGLCEFDKYERVRLGQGRPRSRYRPS